jgi:hypothetical protein
MRGIVESRFLISFVVAAIVWTAGWSLVPFPNDNPVLELVHYHKPAVYWSIRLTYVALWFTTPLIATSIVLSLVYIFIAKRDIRSHHGRLPAYPEPAKRKTLSVIVGEVHHPKKPKPAANPYWLTIPERGLYTGIAIVGAIGAERPAAACTSFAEQTSYSGTRIPATRGKTFGKASQSMERQNP